MDDTSTVYEDRDPAWCGNTIVWSRKEGSLYEIWQMNANGTNRHRVTDLTTGSTDAYNDKQPSCNPASTVVSFSRERVGQYFDGIGIWTRVLSTGVETEITDCGEGNGVYSVCFNPTWSPAGTYLAFSHDDAFVGNPGEIFKIVTDSTGLTQLTDNGDDDVQPDWGELAP